MPLLCRIHHVIVVLVLGAIASHPVSAQTVSNIRAEVTNGRIVVTYDLSGNASGYLVTISATREGDTVQPDSLAGDIGKVAPGKNRLVYWEPVLEGRPLDGWSVQVTASTDLKIRWIEVVGGTYRMGSADGFEDDERPVHSVTVSSFKMSATEITFEQYDQFCVETGNKKPRDNGWGRGSQPVINVNWNDAKAYCEWASRQTGTKIRLPYEAEWEYAARSGGKDEKYSGTNSNLKSYGWYGGNSGGRAHSVATKRPNGLGLYDMSGNVWEWCEDWYSDSYYSASPSVDPKGPSSGSVRVLRGGAWDLGSTCRSAVRGWTKPDVRSSFSGFRVVQDLK